MTATSHIKGSPAWSESELENVSHALCWYIIHTNLYDIQPIKAFFYYSFKILLAFQSVQCGIVVLYNINLIQHWLRWWLVAWWHQAMLTFHRQRCFLAFTWGLLSRLPRSKPLNNWKCTGAYSALFLLMPWCLSTRSSVSTVLTKHSLYWASFMQNIKVIGNDIKK